MTQRVELRCDLAMRWQHKLPSRKLARFAPASWKLQRAACRFSHAMAPTAALACWFRRRRQESGICRGRAVTIWISRSTRSVHERCTAIVFRGAAVTEGAIFCSPFRQAKSAAHRRTNLCARSGLLRHTPLRVTNMAVPTFRKITFRTRLNFSPTAFYCPKRLNRLLS